MSSLHDNVNWPPERFSKADFSGVRSDEELTLESSALETLYDGQFTILSSDTPHRHSTKVPLETYALYSIVFALSHVVLC